MGNENSHVKSPGEYSISFISSFQYLPWRLESDSVIWLDKIIIATPVCLKASVTHTHCENVAWITSTKKIVVL